MTDTLESLQAEWDEIRRAPLKNGIVWSNLVERMFVVMTEMHTQNNLLKETLYTQPPEVPVIEQSDAVDSLAAALTKAQAKIKPAAKDSTNPYFNSTYADLTAVWDACRGPLTDNELSVVQSVGYEVGDPPLCTVTTTLLHSSGQWIRSTAKAPMSKQDAQGVGSVVTYLRRYTLAAAAGVAPEDDDGNAASKPHKNETARRTEEQHAAALAELKRLAKSNKALHSKVEAEWGRAKVDPDYAQQLVNTLQAETVSK